MVGSDSRTIDGKEIVAELCGSNTGDRLMRTSDGRVWEEHRNGVPNSLPTGTVVRPIESK